MEVNEHHLIELLQDLVYGFNDCACCPLMFDCERREKEEGIDPVECAEILKDWLK